MGGFLCGELRFNPLCSDAQILRVFPPLSRIPGGQTGITCPPSKGPPLVCSQCPAQALGPWIHFPRRAKTRQLSSSKRKYTPNCSGGQSPKSRCQQCWFLQGLKRRTCSRPLSQLLTASGKRWCPQACGHVALSSGSDARCGPSLLRQCVAVSHILCLEGQQGSVTSSA